MARIKVMTFNLRHRLITDGKNFFDFRRDKIAAMIRSEQPDLIGFQEANDEMADWLTEELHEYTVIGHGRDVNFCDEGSYVAFRKDRFRLHAFRSEMLSLHPQQGGSRFEGIDQSRYPRAYTCAELFCKENHKLLAFYNIHTDHKGEAACLLECAFLMRDVCACGMPFVITGDFNAKPDSAPIGLVLSTADSLGTVDATRHIKGSFHGFKGDVGNCKIDYIFTNMQVDPAKTYAVADDDSCGCYYSDHNAICAFLSL